MEKNTIISILTEIESDLIVLANDIEEQGYKRISQSIRKIGTEIENVAYKAKDKMK